MRVLLALFLLLAAAVAESDEIVAGVDLDRVDWPSFCRSTEAVPLGNCEISHPTNGAHGVHKPWLPESRTYVCDSVEENFERLTTCNWDRDPSCSFCRNAWKFALENRERHPDWYEPEMRLEAFRARYFSDALAGD